MAKIGFIGMGNMGYAILKGLLKEYDREELLFTDADDRQDGAGFLRKPGYRIPVGIAACVELCRYVVLAIKPQYYEEVLKEIAPVLGRNQIVISIAPGITIAQLKEKLGDPMRIVRAMPNTPALVGEGMTGVSYDPALYSAEEEHTICSVFQSFGKMKRVEERLMDAVVCVSGSSPAYVYMMIEALADSAVKYGISRKDAYEMAAQTLYGSAKMVLETGLHPGILKDQVCSPGGTTITAVTALEEYGFRNAVLKASDACYDKCKKMSRSSSFRGWTWKGSGKKKRGRYHG